MRRVAPYAKDLYEIIELSSACLLVERTLSRQIDVDISPVNISNDGHRCANVHDVGLAHEDLLCLFADLAEEGLVEELLAEELLDARVEIEGRHADVRMGVRGGR